MEISLQWSKRLAEMIFFYNFLKIFSSAHLTKIKFPLPSLFVHVHATNINIAYWRMLQNCICLFCNGFTSQHCSGKMRLQKWHVITINDKENLFFSSDFTENISFTQKFIPIVYLLLFEPYLPIIPRRNIKYNYIRCNNPKLCWVIYFA